VTAQVAATPKVFLKLDILICLVGKANARIATLQRAIDDLASVRGIDRHRASASVTLRKVALTLRPALTRRPQLRRSPLKSWAYWTVPGPHRGASLLAACHALDLETRDCHGSVKPWLRRASLAPRSPGSARACPAMSTAPFSAMHRASCLPTYTLSRAPASGIPIYCHADRTH
jgi:hypothetical protein